MASEVPGNVHSEDHLQRSLVRMAAVDRHRCEIRSGTCHRVMKWDEFEQLRVAARTLSKQIVFDAFPTIMIGERSMSIVHNKSDSESTDAVDYQGR